MYIYVLYIFIGSSHTNWVQKYKGRNYYIGVFTSGVLKQLIVYKL